MSRVSDAIVKHVLEAEEPPRALIAMAIRKAYPVWIEGTYGREAHEFDAKTGNFIADFMEENWSDLKRHPEDFTWDAVYRSYTIQGYNVFPKDEKVIKVLVSRIVKRLQPALK